MSVPSGSGAAGPDPAQAAWRTTLPDLVARCTTRWRLRVGEPFAHDGMNAWVAPVALPDGSEAVLKLGFPHVEAADEAAGLRFWAGDPMVRLLDEDAEANALLLERCRPGHDLRRLPGPAQDRVVAGLLARAWRPAPAGFRTLADLWAFWTRELRAGPGAVGAAAGGSDAEGAPSARDALDRALVAEAVAVADALNASDPDPVLLATDLHAGNVLAAEREPWLAIDPKPFVGDRAFDPVQHLLNRQRWLDADPRAAVRDLAALAEVDEGRLRGWTFARSVLEAHWGAPGAAALARRLGPA